MIIHVTLNGKQQTWDVSPGEKLADVLRKHGCYSVKIGCGEGVCGTCTVLLDGKLILSCKHLAVRADGKEIVTVEGLGEEGDKIAKCLVDRGGEGCGYCAPAFVIITYQMKKELKDPTREDVRAYLNGNLCRCTGYAVRVDAAMAYLAME